MSYKTKIFEWDVSPTPDQIGVPVGYEFEFHNQDGSHILYNLSTFRENAVKGSIFYSFDKETFFDFPLGDDGFAFYTDYTMRVKITDAMSENIFALSDGVIYRLSGDSTKVIERFDPGINLSFLSIDHKSNDIYSIYDKTLFSFYTNNKIRLKKSFNLNSLSLEIIIDGSRDVFWQITSNSVFKRSLLNSKILETYLLGSTITGNIRKFLDKNSGNVVFSAETSSGFQIFELDFYSSTIISDTSSNLILDIDKGNSGYFVVFGNQYLGRFLSGTLDETYISTGRSNIQNISGDLDIFYLIDGSSQNVIKFSIPYTEEWGNRIITGNQGFLKARGNDESVVYSGGGLITCTRDDGVNFKRLPINNDTIFIELSSQTKCSHTAFRYKAVYGDEALDQSSSSSSESSSSSSLDSSSSSSEIYSESTQSESTESSSTSLERYSESTSSEGYSQSTQSESTQSESIQSESSSSSELYSESSSSSELYSESTSSELYSESSSSSELYSESSSSSELYSESSSSSELYSESSSSSELYSESSSSTSFNYSESSSSNSSESIGNFSTSSSSNSSESIGNTTSSSTSIDCSYIRISHILGNQIYVNLYGIIEDGSVCVDEIDEGIYGNGVIIFNVPGTSSSYSVGQLIKVCEGNCPESESSSSSENETQICDNTKLLLHCDGNDGSTNFIDEMGNTVIAFGNAQIDTSQSKFGGASGLFNGTDSYISIQSSEWNFGSSDWTIDMWFYGVSGATSQDIISSIDNDTLRVSLNNRLIVSPPDRGAVIIVGSSSFYIGSDGEWTDNSWHHLALVRDNSTIRCFIDGILEGTTSISGNLNFSGELTFGSLQFDPVINLFNGWIDEVRVVNEISVWTSNFTPPTAPYDCSDISSSSSSSDNYSESSSSESFAVDSESSSSVGYSESSESSSSDPPVYPFSDGEKIYSIFLESDSYAGDCMQITRDTGGTLEVGFDENGYIDVAAIETFCSGTIGYISIFYDQSGNGRNLTPYVTNGAIIYNGGLFQDPWGYIYANFSTDNSMEHVDTDVITQPYTYYVRAIAVEGAYNRYVDSCSGGPATGILQYTTNRNVVFAPTWVYGARSSISGSMNRLCMFDGASSIARWGDLPNESVSPGTNGVSEGTSIGKSNGSRRDGTSYVQRVVGWSSDKSADFDYLMTSDKIRFNLSDLSEDFSGSMPAYKWTDPSLSWFAVSGGALKVDTTINGTTEYYWRMNNIGATLDHEDWEAELSISNVALRFGGAGDIISFRIGNIRLEVQGTDIYGGDYHTVYAMNASGTSIWSTNATPTSNHVFKFVKIGTDLDFYWQGTQRATMTIPDNGINQMSITARPRAGSGPTDFTADFDSLTITSL